MPALSIEALISLALGIPSLIVALLTLWEARRTRREARTIGPEHIIIERLVSSSTTQRSDATTPSELDGAIIFAQRQRHPHHHARASQATLPSATSSANSNRPAVARPSQTQAQAMLLEPSSSPPPPSAQTRYRSTYTTMTNPPQRPPQIAVVS